MHQKRKHICSQSIELLCISTHLMRIKLHPNAWKHCLARSGVQLFRRCTGKSLDVVWQFNWLSCLASQDYTSSQPRKKKNTTKNTSQAWPDRIQTPKPTQKLHPFNGFKVLFSLCLTPGNCRLTSQGNAVNKDDKNSWCLIHPSSTWKGSSGCSLKLFYGET